MKDLEPTLDVLSNIVKARGTNMSAVALNYNISKGAVPIVGMRSPEQPSRLQEYLDGDSVRARPNESTKLVWMERQR
jgi:aryl-alcohol dehydrogenase-like predicted oxidoreductase